jgi:leucyl/phenylalanyl-tRNA--protein transferase
MPTSRFTNHIAFPDPRQADADGLVAYGGDLSPQRLLAAYTQGIFPWPYDENWPVLWYSPDPRMVLLPTDLHVSHSLQKMLHRRTFEVRFDTAFAQVIHRCATTKRPGQRGTWITTDMMQAYCHLHELGLAHSAEAWADGELVGGLYGVSLGAMFFGESMFTRQANASKAAFVQLVRQLQAWEFHLVDCQTYSAHLAHFGAVMWPRERFLRGLARALQVPTRRGCWTLPAASPPSPLRLAGTPGPADEGPNSQH